MYHRNNFVGKDLWNHGVQPIDHESNLNIHQNGTILVYRGTDIGYGGSIGAVRCRLIASTSCTGKTEVRWAVKINN